MRVLLLNYEYPPCGSGAGLATEALAEGLATRGMTVDVVAGGEHASTDPRLIWDGESGTEGRLTVHRVPSRRLGTKTRTRCTRVCSKPVSTSAGA